MFRNPSSIYAKRGRSGERRPPLGRRLLRMESLESRTLLANTASNVLWLDAIDDEARAADTDLLDLGSRPGEGFTIEAFIYVPTNATGVQDIVYKNYAYSFSINFHPDAADFVFLNIWDSPSSFGRHQLGQTLEIGPGWHHVAAEFDNAAGSAPDRFAIYMDGQLVVEALNASFDPGINAYTRELGVGGYFGGGLLGGAIDELRISNVPRYTGDFYTVPTEEFQADAHTIALYHFNEADGATSFADASGNGNTLSGLNGAHTSSPWATGDFDQNGSVDSADLTEFLLGWTGSLGDGEGTATPDKGDLDGDRDVDSADLTELLLHWTGAGA